MTQETARVYDGQSAEERVAERERRFKEAALDVIGTEGWSAATIRRLASRAGVGPRYFYESWANVTELAIAVYDELAMKVLGDVVTALGTSPIELRPASYLAAGTVIRTMTDDPRVARFLLNDAPALAARKALMTRTLSAEISRRWRASGSTLSDTRRDVASLLIAFGSAEIVLAWLDGELDADREELIAIVAETINAMAANMQTFDD